MTNEEFQKLVMDKLAELSEGQKDLKADLAVLNAKWTRNSTAYTKI